MTAYENGYSDGINGHGNQNDYFGEEWFQHEDGYDEAINDRHMVVGGDEK